MLSYQHIYHAGCLADVHKHSILSIVFSQFLENDNAITYMETHSGRGLYDLNSPEAQKTGEAKSGIEAILEAKVFPETHPFIRTINQIRKRFGRNIYPGSPALAKFLLRPKDRLELMELHPQEIVYLRKSVEGANAHVHFRDGYKGVLEFSPPRPLQRGIVFIDPSYEIKNEYQDVVAFIQNLQKKWPEATIVLWYPMLKARLHEDMREKLLKLEGKAPIKNVVLNEIEFSNPLNTKGLYGSGMLLMNVPANTEEKIKDCKVVIEAYLATLR